MLPWGDRASRAWLARTNNPYAGEIDAIAAILGRAGAHTLNVCFEWGCTSGVWRNADGALLRRVLDWPFPTLGESVVVARQDGPAGEFFNMTWPGANGIFHATAPGRFAAAINQAPSRRHGAGYVGDWFLSRLAAEAVPRDCPPPTCCATSSKPRRTMARPSVCFARRHSPFLRSSFSAVSTMAASSNAPKTISPCAKWRPAVSARPTISKRAWTAPVRIGAPARSTVSAARLAPARWMAPGEEFAWFRAPIANVNSRLVFTANPATGALALAGTAGEAQVTEIFRLAA